VTRPLHLRVAGGHHTHTVRPSPTMGPGWLTTDCGKTKRASRFRDDIDSTSVTCPGCIAAEHAQEPTP
jgi:hypothetical protein